MIDDTNKTEVLAAFDAMETAIVQALSDYANTATGAGQDLDLLTAVLAKMICAAAIAQERSEEDFIEAMRNTYQLMLFKEKMDSKMPMQ